jgi:hypothetical protein
MSSAKLKTSMKMVLFVLVLSSKVAYLVGKSRKGEQELSPKNAFSEQSLVINQKTSKTFSSPSGSGGKVIDIHFTKRR